MYKELQEHVAAWLTRNAADIPPEELLKLVDRALQGVWQRSVVILSDVTLAAICERVLHNSQRQFPLLASVTLGPEGIQLNGIADRIGTLKTGELKEAVQFLLVELIALIDRITAEILTPTLYAELATVERERRGENEKAPVGRSLPPQAGKRGQIE